MCMSINPFSAKDVLIDFTLSNARRFYSSKGNPLALKGLTIFRRKGGGAALLRLSPTLNDGNFTSIISNGLPIKQLYLTIFWEYFTAFPRIFIFFSFFTEDA